MDGADHLLRASDRHPPPCIPPLPGHEDWRPLCGANVGCGAGDPDGGRPKSIASLPSPVSDGEMPVISGRGMPEGDGVWPMRRSSSAHCPRRYRQPWSVAAAAAGIRGRLHGLQGGAPTCKIVGGAGIFNADSEVTGCLALASDDFALIGTCMPAKGWTASRKLRRNAVELVIRTPTGAPTVCERIVVRR